MEKRKLRKIIIPSFLVIGVLLVFFGYILFGSSTIPAQLHIESGDVLVNSKIAENDLKLKKGDLIETKENSLATIILYESVIVNLEPSTSINVDELTKDHPKLSQLAGETWNTFTKLSGVKSYSLKTGHTIASVRSTSFGLKKGYILGGEGEINYKVGEEEFLVNKLKVIEELNEEILQRNASEIEIEKIKERMQRAVKELKRVREKELERNPLLVKLIKLKTGLNDEELRIYLGDIDDEKIDLDDLVNQSPIQTASIDKIANITRAIQKIKREIVGLNGQTLSS
ncbi:MAG: FecR family protein [Nanoarchaeota archaeon]|nr:FecR family protein [Nanoarchaeota archaeon]